MKVIILLLLFCYINIAYGQTEPTSATSTEQKCKKRCICKSESQTKDPVTLTIDFESKKITGKDSLENLKKGDLYQIKVNNINMNRYNVLIDKKDSIIVSNIEFPTFDMIGLGAITDIIGSLSNRAFSQKSSSFEEQLINLNQTTFSKQKIENLKLSQEKWIHQDPDFKKIVLGNPNLKQIMTENNFFQSNGENFVLDTADLEKISKLFQKEIDSLKAEEESIKSELEKINKQLDLKEQTRAKIRVQIDFSKSETKSRMDVVKDITLEINNSTIPGFELMALYYQESNTDIPKKSILGSFQPPSLESLLDTLFSQRKRLQDNKESIFQISNEYDDFKRKINSDLFKTDSEIRKADSVFIKEIATSKALIDSILTKISNSVVSKFISTIIDLDNNKDRKYTSLPIQHNGDIGKLSITIAPKKPEYGPSYSTEIKFPQKKSFYVGIGMSFYYAWFKDETYSVEATTSDSTKYQIKNENIRRGELGLATLIHFGWQFCDNFSFNFVTGPALSITNPVKPRIALGAGFSYGERSRVSLNVLYMGGFVNRKSVVYNEKIDYDIRPENVTVSKLSGSFGISLGYIYKF